MATLSERIITQLNKKKAENTEYENSDDDDAHKKSQHLPGEHIEFKFIPGFRKNSTIVWAHEKQYLYYFNSQSIKTGIKACTCYDANCNARLYILDESTAYCSPTPHNHGTNYETYMQMYCYNSMKQKTLSAPASAANLEIYKEAIKEYVIKCCIL